MAQLQAEAPRQRCCKENPKRVILGKAAEAYNKAGVSQNEVVMVKPGKGDMWAHAILAVPGVCYQQIPGSSLLNTDKSKMLLRS